MKKLNTVRGASMTLGPKVQQAGTEGAAQLAS